MHFKTIILLFLLSCLTGMTNIAAQEKIEWLTFEEAMEMQKMEPRKVIIDLYTDWCGWCKKMDVATFQKEHIASYINDNYYPVKFNGEYRKTIVFGDQEFKFVPNGRRGYHELAAVLTKGKLSYPTVVFLQEDMSIIQAIPGFRSPLDFEKIMTYFGENHHKNVPWSSYENRYVPIRVKNKNAKFIGNK